MLINCPLSKKLEVIPLIKAGADLFYAGISSNLLFNSSKGIVNRRPWKNANFNSLKEFEDALDLIYKHNKKLYLTINEHFYSGKQIKKIIEFISNHNSIDGFLVTDIGLMLELKKKFPNIYLIASTGTHIQNKKAIEFYINLGVSEIIIPRHFKISEIKKLTSNYPNIKFECFIKNEDCVNIDGLCCYSHGFFDSDKISNPCRLLNNFRIKSNNNKPDKIKQRLNNYNSIMAKRCGACYIHELSRIDISKVKIVGRTMPLENKLKDVLFIKKAITDLSLSKKEFVNKVKQNYKQIYKKECKKRCFYDF